MGIQKNESNHLQSFFFKDWPLNGDSAYLKESNHLQSFFLENVNFDFSATNLGSQRRINTREEKSIIESEIKDSFKPMCQQSS